jgi:hypothetical protein
MGDIPARGDRALRLYGKKLLRRAVDCGLLVPRETEEGSEVPSDESDRWFDLERFEVCRAADFFDVHVHDPELNKNPPFRPGRLHPSLRPRNWSLEADGLPPWSGGRA